MMHPVFLDSYAGCWICIAENQFQVLVSKSWNCASLVISAMMMSRQIPDHDSSLLSEVVESRCPGARLETLCEMSDNNNNNAVYYKFPSLAELHVQVDHKKIFDYIFVAIATLMTNQVVSPIYQGSNDNMLSDTHVARIDMRIYS